MDRRLALLAILAAPALRPAHAFADGAFPDSMAIFAPADAPHRITLGTNFGLLISEDDGANFFWVCEQQVAGFVVLYQHGPAPADTIFAVTPDDVRSSSDLACTWTAASGTGAFLPSDLFPDPTDPAHVLIIGRSRTGSAAYSVYESRDGGATVLPDPLYTARIGRKIESVESARSDPRTIYLTTTSSGSKKHPELLRSTDGGAHFEAYAADDPIGDRRPAIAAVDPQDANVIYLRVRKGPDETGDVLGISRDGGQTVRLALTMSGAMTGFLRRSDGALIALGLEGSFISTDGGMNFSPWTTLHLRAIAERDGALYAAADNFEDLFSVGVSRDGGATWTPLMRFDQIKGPQACAANTCAAPWIDLQNLFGINPMQPDGGGGKTCSCTAVHCTTGQGRLLLIVSLLALRRRRRH